MRLLFATKSLPGPIVDGHVIRDRAVLGRLLDLADIDVVSYARGQMPLALAERVDSITTIPIDETARSPLQERALFALSGRGLYHRVPAFVSAMRAAGAAHRPDVVWFSNWHMLPYADVARAMFPDAVLVADLADDEVRNIEMERDKATTKREQLGLWRQALRQRDLERRSLRHVDAVLFVSEADAATCRRRNANVRIETRPNGVDTEYFAPSGVRVDDPVFVFEGTMNFAPNVEAALHFVRDIFPHIERRLPGARALIVGRDPTPEVRALEREAVEITGTVDDVRDEIKRAAVFVCPMRGGVGQKNKIMQAWALQIPIVATSLAVAGLAAEPDVDLIVSDDAEAFADACVELVRDPERRERLGRAGRRKALERYSIERRMDDIATLVEDLVGRRLPSRREDPPPTLPRTHSNTA